MKSLFARLLSAIFTLCFLIITLQDLHAQKSYEIKGRVTDVNSGDPVPFANIYFKGTTSGATTDFDGFYRFETSSPGDSLVASYIGYITRIKSFDPRGDLILNFQLEESVTTLKEIVFESGENPAFDILRKVVNAKKSNDKRSLEAYEFESYTKIEVDVDNISEDLRNSNMMRQITQVLDSIDIIAGEDGKTILPIFISEAISRFYYKKNPYSRHENVIKTKLSGVGITDGTLTSQVIGSSLQEYNFYQNWLNIVEKEFISPIADSWRASYDYYLIDSMYIDGFYCYRLDLSPKRDQDLAFNGTIWVDRASYALKQVDLTVNRKANLNFIEKIKIQQELEPTAQGPWLPVKSRVLIDVGEITKDMAGFLAKFYVSNKDFILNEPHNDAFYRLPVVMEEDVRQYEDGYWEINRHDSLSSTEINVFQMIDTLKTIPLVKTTTDMVKFVSTGYHPIGKVDLGPYTVAYASNTVEGLRLGFGMRTNYSFSKKIELKASTGYGFKDEDWKYRGRLRYIINRRPWTEISFQTRKEIDELWLISNDLDNSSIFYAYTRFGELTDPFISYTNEFRFQTQIGTGFTQKIFFKSGFYEPLFDFTYYEDPYASDLVLKSDLRTTEIGFETRYARDELFIINDNVRLSLGTTRWPAITFRYILGLDNVLRGDFRYHKLEMKIEKTQKMGMLGTGYFKFSGGYIIGQLPYPLLVNHIGNESPFYLSLAYNLMDFSEFTSDEYYAFRYRHSFQGLILNRIPLIKKLKLRLVGTTNLLWGSVRQENFDIIPQELNSNGELVYPFNSLDDGPYVELGYGVENILKVGRIDFIHRLSYTDKPGINNFGIKISFQFLL